MFSVAYFQVPFFSGRACALSAGGFSARLTVRFWKGTSTKPRGETSAAFFPARPEHGGKTFRMTVPGDGLFPPVSRRGGA